MSGNEAIRRLSELVVKHGSQKLAAKAIGISAVYFGDLLRGKRDPGPKVLRALGLTKATVYQAVIRAGMKP